jgi:transporter family-2 protein
MKLVLVALALLAGAGLACQVGINSHLRLRLGHPIPAALANFAVGLAILLAAGLATSTARPPAGATGAVPWWAWLGGLVGACYVLSSAAFAKQLGAAGWLASIVTGQILASLVLDHFGLIGFRPHPLSPARVAGVVLLLAGVLLVLRS